MQQSKTSLIVITMLVLITIFVASLSNSEKKIDNPKSASGTIKFANDTFKVRPLTDVRYEATEQRLKRGEYLANGILMCFTCHTPRNWDSTGAPLLEGKKGSGGNIIERDSFHIVIAPNITPDKETGAGTWTDDMLARAIREGVGHDGRALSWQMPYNVFRNMCDEDLAAVIVYLRSIPAIHNVVPPTKLTPEERSGTEKSMRPIMQPVAAPDLSDAVKRGMYLVRIGECVGCHTAGTEYNPGLFAGGNFAHRYQRAAFSANLTSDSSGLAYGENGFLFVMKTGKGGTLSPVMPWISFKNMTDEDLKNIYAYLKTIPPSSHYVSNQQPFADCAICGQKHGLGEMNKRHEPRGIKLVPELLEQFVGTYQEDEWKSTYIVKRKGSKLVVKGWENGPELELFAQTELRYIGAGLPLPIHFVKDEDGHVTQLVEETDYGRVFKKLAPTTAY